MPPRMALARMRQRQVQSGGRKGRAFWLGAQAGAPAEA